MRMQVLAVLGLLVTAATSAAQTAQPYPVRPIRLITSNAVGSGSDVVARVLAPRLSELLGQQVVVDNRAGASGLIAAELVARAAPDGHTMWIVTLTQLISTTLYDRFHLAREYASIGMIGGTPFVIAVNSGLNVKSVAELIALAKAKPGFLMYGSSGTGTSLHLCMELLQQMAGVKMVHVPYKGAMMALTDMMGGQMHSACVAAPTMSLLAGNQKVRALAVTTKGATSLAPGLPPVADTLPGYELNGWYGMLAPPGTPRAIITRLNQEFAKLLAEPAMRERLLSVGAEPAASTPEEFSAYLKKETARWGKLLKEAGVKPQ